MTFKMRYQDHDFEGEQARRFAEQILKAIQPAYPEYTGADADAYDYGSQYEVILTTNTGEKRRLRFKMKERPSAILASIAFIQKFHTPEEVKTPVKEESVNSTPDVVEAILLPATPEPKRKPGRPKKVKNVG